jgi:RNA polymerase sigma-70 factor (ECF subfamily)
LTTPSPSPPAGSAEVNLDLERLRRQDVGEFTRFVGAYEHFVLGLCQTLGLTPADCDDAAAETFALAYKALPGFRADSQLSTWLYRIAYRTSLKVRRRYPKSANTSELAEQVSDSRDEAPSRTAENQDTAAAIWQAVGKLDPEQAAAVEMFYRRGLSVEEIGEVMGKPVGTVKTLLFRARERLRFLLQSMEKM